MADIEVKVHQEAGTIVMQRAEVGNALNQTMIEGLEQALDDLHQERKIRYVILTASGSHFCTGLDLAELQSRTAAADVGDGMIIGPEVHLLWHDLSELLLKILRYPKPVIAAVDGAALGGGFALALACDLIVASSRSQFGSPATQRGLVAAAVGPLLHFRLGGAAAGRMLLTGTTIDADAALQCGLTSDLVAAEQIWTCAQKWGAATAEAPAEAVQMTKRLLNETIGESLLTQLTVAAGMGAAASTTQAASEGIGAFLEKRDPQWP